MQAQDILPDGQNSVSVNGSTIRKGSVGAMLANWRIISSTGDDSARQQAMADLMALLPALHALGLFDIMQARDPRLAALIAGTAPDAQ